MTDEQFDRLMRDAAQSYHPPPEIVPVEEMWMAIERERSADDADGPGVHPVLTADDAGPRSWQRWGRMAAVLMIGIAVGRGSSFLHLGRANGTGVATGAAAVTASADGSTMSYQDQSITSAYLGQAAALMISLPGELKSNRRDSAFMSRADNLLLQTRLLLDSPNGADPALHSLFQDMEVVLAQVVRLQTNRDPVQVDLVINALEQRDVLPRLRLAVADHIAN